MFPRRLPVRAGINNKTFSTRRPSRSMSSHSLVDQLELDAQVGRQAGGSVGGVDGRPMKTRRLVHSSRKQLWRSGPRRRSSSFLK